MGVTDLVGVTILLDISPLLIYLLDMNSMPSFLSLISAELGVSTETYRHFLSWMLIFFLIFGSSWWYYSFGGLLTMYGYGLGESIFIWNGVIGCN